MTDLGNAVDAKWVGPNGLQLWDGTVLNVGDVALSIGKDEAEGSPYWEVLGPAGTATAGHLGQENKSMDITINRDGSTNREAIVPDEVPQLQQLPIIPLPEVPQLQQLPIIPLPEPIHTEEPADEIPAPEVAV